MTNDEGAEMKLLNCPFCGSQPFGLSGGSGNTWVINCESCYTDGPQRRTEGLAIEAWNTRAPVSAVLDEVLEDFSDRIKYTDWAEDGYVWLQEKINRAKERVKQWKRSLIWKNGLSVKRKRKQYKFGKV